MLVGSRRTLASRKGGGAPVGFSFPFTRYPITFRWTGSAWVSTFSAPAYAAAALAGTTYYVDIATGNNANTGLTTGQKLKSIHAAVTKGNATGASFNIVVTAGTYPRNHGPTNSATVFPTQPCAMVATGGRVISGAMDDLTWTVNGTYANVYQTTRSNVLRVIDMGHTDAYGDYTELAQVADLATCAATEDSWAQVSTTLYVNRLDNAVVADANTRALILVDNMKLDATTKDFYAKGFDFLGGQGGAVQLNSGVGNQIFDDCSAKFSGGPAALLDGFRIVDVQGLTAFVSCIANQNAKDGFNWHRTSAPAGSVVGLLVNCVGKNNGRYTSQSNNGLTAHEDVTLIDVNGLYVDNYGGTVHIIDSSQLWALGSSASGSRGDISLGGGLGPQEFRTEGTSRMWLDRAIANARSSGDYAVRALDTSIILKRNVTIVKGVQNAAAGATIGAY